MSDSDNGLFKRAASFAGELAQSGSAGLVDMLQMRGLHWEARDKAQKEILKLQARYEEDLKRLVADQVKLHQGRIKAAQDGLRAKLEADYKEWAERLKADQEADQKERLEALKRELISTLDRRFEDAKGHATQAFKNRPNMVVADSGYDHKRPTYASGGREPPPVLEPPVPPTPYRVEPVKAPPIVSGFTDRLRGWWEACGEKWQVVLILVACLGLSVGSAGLMWFFAHGNARGLKVNPGSKASAARDRSGRAPAAKPVPSTSLPEVAALLSVKRDLWLDILVAGSQGSGTEELAQNVYGRLQLGVPQIFDRAQCVVLQQIVGIELIDGACGERTQTALEYYINHTGQDLASCCGSLEHPALGSSREWSVSQNAMASCVLRAHLSASLQRAGSSAGPKQFLLDCSALRGPPGILELAGASTNVEVKSGSPAAVLMDQLSLGKSDDEAMVHEWIHSDAVEDDLIRIAAGLVFGADVTVSKLNPADLQRLHTYIASLRATEK